MKTRRQKYNFLLNLIRKKIGKPGKETAEKLVNAHAMKEGNNLGTYVDGSSQGKEKYF